MEVEFISSDETQDVEVEVMFPDGTQEVYILNTNPWLESSQTLKNQIDDTGSGLLEFEVFEDIEDEEIKRVLADQFLGLLQDPEMQIETGDYFDYLLRQVDKYEVTDLLAQNSSFMGQIANQILNDPDTEAAKRAIQNPLLLKYISDTILIRPGAKDAFAIIVGDIYCSNPEFQKLYTEELNCNSLTPEEATQIGYKVIAYVGNIDRLKTDQWAFYESPEIYKLFTVVNPYEKSDRIRVGRTVYKGLYEHTRDDYFMDALVNWPDYNRNFSLDDLKQTVIMGLVPDALKLYDNTDQTLLLTSEEFEKVIVNNSVELIPIILQQNPGLVDGSKPLTIAISLQYEDMTATLMDSGFKSFINTPNNFNIMPLFVAVGTGNQNLVQYLLNEGADPNGLSRNTPENPSAAMTALQVAVCSTNPNNTRLLLEAGANPNHLSDGYTPLYLAAVNNYPENLTYLINARANVNTKSKVDPTVANSGTTPLHGAIQAGNTENVQILVDAGANVNLPSVGQTPLYMAAISGNPEIVRILVDAGAGLNPDTGDLPFYGAIKSANPDTVKILIDAGADVNEMIDDHSLIYLAATETMSLPIVKLLSKAGTELTNEEYQEIAHSKPSEIRDFIIEEYS